MRRSKGAVQPSSVSYCKRRSAAAATATPANTAVGTPPPPPSTPFFSPPFSFLFHFFTSFHFYVSLYARTRLFLPAFIYLFISFRRFNPRTMTMACALFSIDASLLFIFLDLLFYFALSCYIYATRCVAMRYYSPIPHTCTHTIQTITSRTYADGLLVDVSSFIPS